ncbi:MAG: hypothetical protein WAW13_03950 [Minisyncoccia bacterium]
MLNIQDFFKTHQPLLFFLVIFFLISPGMIYLFFWQRDLFIDLDWVKLVILSLSVLVPIALLNAFALLFIEKTEPTSTGKELVQAFTMTSIFSGFFCLIGLVITHLINHEFINFAGLEVLLIILMWLDSRRANAVK